MHNLIELSIIITNYNYERFIDTCIQSCINQENVKIEYEVIVVDDGSTDHSLEIIKQNSNVLCFELNNSGVEIASNYGFAQAKGKYVVRIDADDCLKRNFISNIQGYLNNRVDVIYGNYDEINEQGSVKRKVELPMFDLREILRRGDFLASGTVYRKEAIMSFGPYQTLVKNCGLENYELILLLLNNGSKFLKLDEKLFNYRRHSCNMSEVKKNQIIQYGKNLFATKQYGRYEIGNHHPYLLAEI